MILVNPRCACTARVTVVSLCVCVCVCLSVKSHLTYGASVRPENAVTYSAGNEGQKFVGFSLKLLRCRDPALPPLTAIRTVSHFPAEACMRIIVFTTWCGPKQPFLPVCCSVSSIGHASKQGLSTM